MVYLGDFALRDPEVNLILGILKIYFATFYGVISYQQTEDTYVKAQLYAERVVVREFDGQGKEVSCKEIPYQINEAGLQSKFNDVLYWAVKGLHGLPLRFRDDG